MTNSDQNKTVVNPIFAAHTGAIFDNFSAVETLSANSIALCQSEHEISNKAFESIIRQYVLEIPQVVRFTSTTLRGSLSEMVGHKTEESSILIQKNEDNSLNVFIAIVITFDSHIPSLMNEIEETIRNKIEQTTGVVINKVRICVQDIVKKEEKNEEENND